MLPCDCREAVDQFGQPHRDTIDGRGNPALELDFDYANAQRFHWCGDLAHGSGKFEADYGTGKTTLPTAVSLLSPEAALGEAMFF